MSLLMGGILIYIGIKAKEIVRNILTFVLRCDTLSIR